jgi:hypothetical protein
VPQSRLLLRNFRDPSKTAFTTTPPRSH